MFNLPQHDSRIVPGRPVLATPRESLLAQTEVLGHSQNRIRKASPEGMLVAIAHVVRFIPEESLVVVNVGRCVVTDWQS